MKNNSGVSNLFRYSSLNESDLISIYGGSLTFATGVAISLIFCGGYVLGSDTAKRKKCHGIKK